jgi:4-hydroxy-4-methyl-2-oxoglutarate aldolase
MIEDPPLLTIRRRFERPLAAVIEALRDVPTGYLVDAMGGRGGLHHSIKALVPGKASLAGVAITCHCGPADNLAVFAALDAAEAGDVIVAATDAFAGTAVTGDLLLGMARNKGVAGFVTDGLVRDVVGIEAVGLPVYCAGPQRSRYRRLPHRARRHCRAVRRHRRRRSRRGGRGAVERGGKPSRAASRHQGRRA